MLLWRRIGDLERQVTLHDLVFGVEERLVASGLNGYLEQPDDASIAESQKDPDMKKSFEIRKIAMKAIIDLDHSEKWAQAIQFPSRKAEVTLFCQDIRSSSGRKLRLP